MAFPVIASHIRAVLKSLMCTKGDVESDPKLIGAIDEEKFEEVQYLIQRGSDVNKTSSLGLSPLCHAVNSCNLEIINLLLTNKANVRSDTEVLSLAVAKKSLEITEVLLQNGVDPNIVSKGVASNLFTGSSRKKGQTPLHLAVEIGNIGAVNLLLEYGADINARTQKGLTPLIIAADRGNIEILQVLLESNAAIDLVDSFQRTVFHAAVRNGPTSILETLLDFCFNDFELLLRLGIFEKRFYTAFRTENCIHSDHRLRETEISQNLYTIFLTVIRICLTLGVVPTTIEQILNHPTSENSPTSKMIAADWGKCKREVAQLKTELLGNSGISFFDILTCSDDNQLATIVKNEDVVEMFKSDYLESTFIYYGDILRSQFRKGETRKKLLQKGAEVSHLLFTDYELPDPVIEKILKYLNNKGIKVFNTACKLCNRDE